MLRADVARIFGLPVTDVRIRTPLIGGGFGGKSYCKMEPLVALMSRKAGAPVRLALSMDESMLTLVKHPASLTLTTGVDKQVAARPPRRHQLDGGAYSDASTLSRSRRAFASVAHIDGGRSTARRALCAPIRSRQALSVALAARKPRGRRSDRST